MVTVRLFSDTKQISTAKMTFLTEAGELLPCRRAKLNVCFKKGICQSVRILALSQYRHMKTLTLLSVYANLLQFVVKCAIILVKLTSSNI